MINVKKVIELMQKYDMQTLDEFIIAYCTFTRDLESLHNYMQCKDVMEYVDDNGEVKKGSFFSNALVKNMATKGILMKEPLDNDYNIEFADLYIDEEFANKFFVDAQIAGDELWAAYPNSTTIQGNYIILKKGEKIGNVYYDKDKLIEIYCTKIGSDRELHNSIIKKVLQAKKLGKINFTLRSFVLDSLWEALDESSQEGDYNSKTII